MSDTIVPQPVLNRLNEEWENLTPEAQKAARFILENPADVGISSVREIAEAANVKPNTFVRMARQVGFKGYDDFREPFREAIRRGKFNFPDRAKGLQDISKSGKLGSLYSEMVTSAISGIEDSFNNISPESLENAARAIWSSQKVYTLGVGVNHAIARCFTYLASTGMTDFHAIPAAGSTPSDDLIRAGDQDLLIAITTKPYRKEIVDTVALAKKQGLTIVALSDSPASPIIRIADHGFVVSVETPQFFPSSVSTVALLEMLLSFVIAISDDKIVDRVKAFHDRRHELGLYQE